MKHEADEFNQLWQEEGLTQIRAILHVTSHWMAIPLFSLFWFADILYYPALKWEFLAIRALTIPICLSVNYLVKKINSFKKAQALASVYAIALALEINAMIYLISDPGTSYYAGLNLIAIGSLSFIPFTRKFYAATAAGIYLPFFIIALSNTTNATELHSVIVMSCFILSSVCMCFLIRDFHEGTRKKELRAKLALSSEITSR
ncbi:MAG: adenylate/guanylate cyclase domain-containing protein, partial [Bdellovibrionales bacterium]|nr:adenylate/guanylate cyclase domain-containing protein [Bdellovibrionales bacterium]